MKVLISVFMGLACGFAIQKILTLNGVWFMVLYATIFASTIARFFEGNVIFYGKEHVTCGEQHNTTAKSKVDIYSTLFQFIIFSAMGHLIGNLEYFFYAFIFLNLVDFFWHGGSYLNSKEKNKETQKTSLFWSLSNLAFGIVLLILLHFYNYRIIDEKTTLEIFAASSIIAAIADYYFNKGFYFSKEAKKIFEDF